MNIEAERKLACKLLTRLGASPPINVESIVNSYASVEFDRFPTSCDALLIRKGTERPRLIVSDRLKKFENRYRFTLAHELGHLVMPWQVGSAFCHTDNISFRESDDVSMQMESEANRFASELLLPTYWVRSTVQGSSNFSAMTVVEIARQAKVSPIVVLLSMTRILAPGSMLAMVDRTNTVQYAATSPGSHLVVPSKGSRLSSLDQYISAGGQVSTAGFGNSFIVAVSFRDDARPSEVGSDVCRRGLPAIVQELYVDPDVQKRILGSINGIIGAANSLVRDVDSVGTLFSVLRQRFVGREHLEQLVLRDDFMSFLWAKAHELMARRNSK